MPLQTPAGRCGGELEGAAVEVTCAKLTEMVMYDLLIEEENEGCKLMGQFESVSTRDGGGSKGAARTDVQLPGIVLLIIISPSFHYGNEYTMLENERVLVALVVTC